MSARGWKLYFVLKKLNKRYIAMGNPHFAVKVNWINNLMPLREMFVQFFFSFCWGAQDINWVIVLLWEISLWNYLVMTFFDCQFMAFLLVNLNFTLWGNFNYRFPVIWLLDHVEGRVTCCKKSFSWVTVTFY